MTTSVRSGTFPWEYWERVLFVWAILVKSLLFLTHLGMEFGYDPGGHFEAMSSVSWLHPFFDLRSFYYASHPPLGFLLANTVDAIAGTSQLVSAQIVAFLSSLTILWFLRSTLRELRLLEHPGAIAFLYLALGTPLQSYLTTAVSLDVTVFAFASVTLYSSARLAHRTYTHTFPAAVWVAGFSCAAAALTKESGIIVLAIPFLYAAIAGGKWLLRGKRLLLITGIFLSLVLPYYVVNYYIPEGTFVFNSSTVIGWDVEMREGREMFESDPQAYVRRIFLGDSEQEAHLLPTWRALWRAEDRDAQSWIAEQFIGFYVAVMPWFVGLGFILFLLGMPKNKEYLHLGVVCVLYGLLLLAAQISYMLRFPLDWYYGFNKGIYISSASLGVCFLIAQLAELPGLLPIRFAAARRAAQQALLFAVALFLTANTLIPVY